MTAKIRGASGRPVRSAAIIVASAVGLWSGLAVAPAQAQGTSSVHALRQACGADAHTFCSGVSPGGGRILACLRQNAAQLSPGCQQALTAAKAARQ